jgi:transposase
VDVPGFVGMEGAQAQRAMALRPSGERWAVPHDARGSAPRVDWRQALPPLRLVREAPGGLERAATAAWAAAGLPSVGVNPRPARECARAPGPWAKTAALAARALAHCADVLRPPPRPRPDAQPQERRALLGRRQPLLGLRPAAQNRLAGTRARLTKDSMASSTGLKAARAPLAHDRETPLRASPRWRDHDERVPRAQGMGPVWARTVRRALPELGPLTRPQSAA